MKLQGFFEAYYFWCFIFCVSTQTMAQGICLFSRKGSLPLYSLLMGKLTNAFRV